MDRILCLNRLILSMNEVNGVVDRFPSLVISFVTRNFAVRADFGLVVALLPDFLVVRDLCIDLVGG